MLPEEKPVQERDRKKERETGRMEQGQTRQSWGSASAGPTGSSGV